MSARAARRWLWITALAALPVPIWLLGPGAVPPAHLAELGLAAAAVGVAESFRGVVAWTVVIFLGQALLWAALLWAAAAALARGLGRFRGVAVVLAGALVVVACLLPVYRTPYHASLARATLLEVYR